MSREDHFEEGNLRSDFRVVGSTGNVYEVSIQRTPQCTCPDFGAPRLEFEFKEYTHVVKIFLLTLLASLQANVKMCANTSFLSCFEFFAVSL
jgi:hypothetical protein